MNIGLEQRFKNLIDQSMALQQAKAGEASGHDPHAKVPFTGGARVTNMRGAVVMYFEV